MTARFGSEIEVSSNAYALAEELCGMGLMRDPELHGYHCECNACRYDRDDTWPITGQEDCSCGGEFITIPLHYGSDTSERVFTGMGTAMLNNPPTLTERAGNHVHVGIEGMTSQQIGDVARLFWGAWRMDDTLKRLGRASFSRLRGYNYEAEYNSTFFHKGNSESVFRTKGPHLSLRTHTYEFRLWNSTRAEWRLRMHAGISIAFVEAAKAGFYREEGNYNNSGTWVRGGSPVEAIVREFAPDPDIVTMMQRQLRFTAGRSSDIR